MRTVGFIAFACLMPLASWSQTPPKKVPATSSTKKTSGRKSTAKPARKHSKSATAHSKSGAARHTTASKHRRGSRAKTASWRTRQLAPNPERYKEIQQALAAKGYLKSAPNGVWDNESADAMRHFQQDQNLEPSGKLNSMSLIALGLGPKREGSPTAAPKPSPAPQNPTPPSVPPGPAPQGTAPLSSLPTPAAGDAPPSIPPGNPPKPQL